MFVIKLVVEEELEDTPALGNFFLIRASRQLMKSEIEDLLIQAVENADPAAICDILMDGLVEGPRDEITRWHEEEEYEQSEQEGQS